MKDVGLCLQLLAVMAGVLQHIGFPLLVDWKCLPISSWATTILFKPSQLLNVCSLAQMGPTYPNQLEVEQKQSMHLRRRIPPSECPICPSKLCAREVVRVLLLIQATYAGGMGVACDFLPMAGIHGGRPRAG